MDLRSDFRQLKDLLISWKLPELYEYFKDESINIEELELMKPHHVAELLAHHRMGLRIRFEHKLEMWRRAMNKPLASGPTKYVYASTLVTDRGGPSAAGLVADEVKCTPPAIGRAVAKQDRSTNTEIVLKVDATTNVSAPMPSTVGSKAAQTQPPSSPPSTHLPPPLQAAAPIRLPTDQVDLAKLMPPLKLRKTDVPSTSGSATESAPHDGVVNYVPVTIMADPTTPVTTEAGCGDEGSGDAFYGSNHSTLAQILQESGERGAELLDYYQKHSEFSPNTRTVLIHLIVHFFEKHDYHLSLNTSHQLEREILQMFPNERLENYRTEKRGKIYVKFCNMKRYRKDRGMEYKRKTSGSIGRKSIGSAGSSKDVPTAYGNNESDDVDDVYPVDDDDYAMNGEISWNEPKISMVEIKTESDED